MTNLLKTDMHIHTTNSDGSMSVGEVLDLAKHKGLDGIAITDHDTVSGVAEAIEYGKQIGIGVLSGIEISSFGVTSVHMLGYGIDYKSEELLEVLDDLIMKRRERAHRILATLAKYNIHINEQNLPTGNVGRSHIARELYKSGYVSTMQEAFERYLGEYGIAYIPSNRITPLKAVELICDTGGVAVIAHPMQLYHGNKLEMLIEGLIPYGLGGLEVYYPSHSPKDIEILTALCKKYKLIMTGGSDFHGMSKNGMLNMIGGTTCAMPRELAQLVNL